MSKSLKVVLLDADVLLIVFDPKKLFLSLQQNSLIGELIHCLTCRHARNVANAKSSIAMRFELHTNICEKNKYSNRKVGTPPQTLKKACHIVPFTTISWECLPAWTHLHHRINEALVHEERTDFH